MIEQDDALWLVLDWCRRCGGSGFIEACYECPDCGGTGEEWWPITDDSYDALDLCDDGTLDQDD